MADSWRGLLLWPVLLATACASTPRTGLDTPLGDAGQLVVVQTAAWDAPAGSLRRFERQGAQWRELGPPIPVTIGRAGSAWGLGRHPVQSEGPVKREGDGRSPAGLFAIGTAFGYPENAETGLDYQAMQSSHWCIDVGGSPLYNKVVDSNEVGSAAIKDSTEPMRRDLHVNGDQRYRIGFVIEHNPDGVDMAGSCIFAHVWKSPNDATAGCTAMSDTDMRALLAWLRKERSPRFVLLPEAEYARLRAAWRLP